MSLLKVKGKRNLPLFMLLVILIEAGGYISSKLSGGGGREQYLQLIKPALSPPGWVFPVVWTILYFLMAIAIYRILLWGSYGKGTSKAILYFAVQLLLNYLWSIIFFRFELYGAAFLELILLLIFLFLTTIEFAKIDKKAALLMIPYILWVSFAAYLNYSIWMLNK